jgi:hypothetical protein
MNQERMKIKWRIMWGRPPREPALSEAEGASRAQRGKFFRPPQTLGSCFGIERPAPQAALVNLLSPAA